MLPFCLMKGFNLTKEELSMLRLMHREVRKKNTAAAYKINTIILLGTGWTIKKVTQALLLDDETLKSYVQKYREGKLEELLKTNYKGSECRLSDAETSW